MLNTRLKVDYFGLTDIGLAREHNEDVWKAMPEKGLFLLADGMGGHQAGEVAARKAVEELATAISQFNKENPDEFLRQAIKRANSHVYQEGQKNYALTGMGTTLCCLLLAQDRAIYAHVGDSRIYRFRNSTLELLTQDHSLVNELLSLHGMTEEQALSFPYKHVLTKALGTNSLVEPTFNSSSIEENDLFLLCSDGLTNYVSDKAIRTILLSSDTSLEKIGESLIELAKKQGGGDNITALLVKVEKA